MSAIRLILGGGIIWDLEIQSWLQYKKGGRLNLSLLGFIGCWSRSRRFQVRWEGGLWETVCRPAWLDVALLLVAGYPCGQRLSRCKGGGQGTQMYFNLQGSLVANGEALVANSDSWGGDRPVDSQPWCCHGNNWLGTLCKFRYTHVMRGVQVVWNTILISVWLCVLESRVPKFDSLFHWRVHWALAPISVKERTYTDVNQLQMSGTQMLMLCTRWKWNHKCNSGRLWVVLLTYYHVTMLLGKIELASFMHNLCVFAGTMSLKLGFITKRYFSDWSLTQFL